jgi:hypothetical protein
LLHKGGAAAKIEFERHDGLDSLENLQLVNVIDIYDKSVMIIENFFNN